MPSALAIIPQVLKKKPGAVRLLEAGEGAALRPAAPPQPRRSANGVEADKARRSLGDCTATAPAGDLPSAGRDAAKALLGRYGKIASPPAPSPAGEPGLAAARALVQRFVLQNAARRLMPLESVAGCLRRRQSGKEFVEVWHLPEVMRAKYAGLQTCNSVWLCPVCAAKITERRRLEVREGIDAWNAQGGDVALVTFTVRHSAGDALRGLVAGMMGALRRISAGKMGQLMRSRYGVEGMIRSVEVTYGSDNGWHPHIHMLVFTKRACRFELLWRHYRKQWDNALRLEQMRDVTARGVDMRWANEDVAEYIAKMGHERTWDIEHELTKGPSKLGRGEHFSPVQLLAAYADHPTEDLDRETGEVGRVSEFGRLWRVYAAEMKGTHQLRWSPGLRKRLGLGKVKTDAEIAAEKDKLGTLLARLEKKEWALVLHFEARAELLNVAAAGDADQVRFFLWDLDGRFACEERTEKRFKSSLQDNRTRWDDQREAEAEELGLTRSEYLRWRRGGIEAMANEAPLLAGAAADPGIEGEVRGNSSTLKVLGRRLVASGREKVAALPLLTSGDVDEGSDAAGVEYESNGYSERFRNL